MRVERFALFFPPLIVRRKRGETEYGDRRDPARRLREDHRDEPAGGDPAGGRAPRLLPPAGLEADRRDRRGAGREHRDRVPDPVGAAAGNGIQEPRPRSRAVAASRPPRLLQPVDRIVSVDGVQGRRRAMRKQISHAQVRRHADQRLRGRDVRDAARRARRQASSRSASRPPTTPAQERMLVGFVFAGHDTQASARRRGSRAVDEMWFVTRKTVETIANIFNAESARRSPASSGPTR